MIEFSSWTQVNWYAVGTLLTQLGFLIAGVWFAHSILKIIRSFQEQVGALLKLSISAGPNEARPEATGLKRSIAETSPYWLTPSETQIASQAAPEPVASGPSRFVVAWHGLLHWLITPMNSSWLAPWRRVIHWLQAPAGH